MKRLIPLIFLAACTPTAGPGFLGNPPVEVTRDGRQYLVFQDGNRVEVIRKGYAVRGEHQAIRETMIALIPEVTGCKLRESSVTGDSGVMRASVTCG